jgi:hypothetical protein
MFRSVVVGLLMVGSFALGMLAPTVRTQEAPLQGTGEYVVVNFMRVPPGKTSDYIAVERDVWKPVHQARIRDGKLKSWALWQKRFGGTSDGYEFATVNSYGKLEDVDTDLQSYLARANPGTKLADVQRQTQATREISRSEVWRILDQAK